MMPSVDDSLRERVRAIQLIVSYNPVLSALIAVFGVVAALFEGIGMTFVIPIIEAVQKGNLASANEQGGVIGAFHTVYQFFGIPFELEYLILGVVGVMTVRYAASFSVAWLRARLRTLYIRDLQREAFSNALDARVAFFDTHGSDDILNTIITETFYAGRAIKRLVILVEQVILSLLYISIAFYLAPVLTLFAAVLFGGISYFARNIVETGYDVGSRVAEANERVQQTVQAGTQGIRTVKLFGLREEIYGDFRDAVDQFTEASVSLRRNDEFVTNVNQLLSAAMVFLFIYLLIRLSSLSFSAFALFLFAMFRLAPRISTVNQKLYQTEGDLPHVVRTNRFIENLSENQEPRTGDERITGDVHPVEFDDVTFSYRDGERILEGFDLEIDQGEFVAFVGPSGAGKSTIVSLLTRLYEPDEGEVRANGTPIRRIDVDDWRSRMAVVRQNPFIFNDTLRYNLTLGKRDATEDELRRVCEIAKVDEFLDELANGFDTELGDDGVQLSGGQRQRVALARALLKDGVDILVLDEATSNLDSDLEREVQTEIERMDEKYTVVAIAHRLSTVKNADCIYVLEDGRLIEQGPHGHLVSNDGTYANLYATQISG